MSQSITNQSHPVEAPKKPYYFVQMDEGRMFFDTSEEFLECLQDNGEMECGCEMLTPDEAEQILTSGVP